jgi:hypothetical protein
MQHAGMASTMIWVWRKISRYVKGYCGERGTAPSVSIDEHIAGQWSEGRRRLDSLLRLIGKMGLSLERDVETLGRLDPADPLYEREARRRVAPTLRRFAFDKHLRDECRMLVPLLQFCGKDLADSQGLDTAAQLRALASLQIAMESTDRH